MFTNRFLIKKIIRYLRKNGKSAFQGASRKLSNKKDWKRFLPFFIFFSLYQKSSKARRERAARRREVMDTISSAAGLLISLFVLLHLAEDFRKRKNS